MRRLLPLPVLAIAILLAAAPGAAARTVWLCKPGLATNPCLATLTTTVIESDGSTRVERTRRPRRPKIDCFYVYPTVSAQPGVNATRAKDPEILAVARVQASRFSPHCRVFAPVYRQLTPRPSARRTSTPPRPPGPIATSPPPGGPTCAATTAAAASC